VAHVRVYIEDTIDLILWYPELRKLELIDFQTQPLKRLDSAWPTTSMLFKQYLAERLQIRWPFETLTLTYCRATPSEITTSSVDFDCNSGTRIHWEELVATLEQMKHPPSMEQIACSATMASPFNTGNLNKECRYCSGLAPFLEVSDEGKLQLIYKSA
jgi:hypothetical protein